MAITRTRVQEPSKQSRIEPGTPEMEKLLHGAYGMTVEDAQTIVKERKETPALWPYAEYKKAIAFLAAYNGRPKAVSSRRPWQINGRVPAEE